MAWSLLSHTYSPATETGKVTGNFTQDVTLHLTSAHYGDWKQRPERRLWLNKHAAEALTKVSCEMWLCSRIAKISSSYTQKKWKSQSWVLGKGKLGMSGLFLQCQGKEIRATIPETENFIILGVCFKYSLKEPPQVLTPSGIFPTIASDLKKPSYPSHFYITYPLQFCLQSLLSNFDSRNHQL